MDRIEVGDIVSPPDFFKKGRITPFLVVGEVFHTETSKSFRAPTAYMLHLLDEDGNPKDGYTPYEHSSPDLTIVSKSKKMVEENIK